MVHFVLDPLGRARDLGPSVSYGLVLKQVVGVDIGHAPLKSGKADNSFMKTTWDLYKGSFGSLPSIALDPDADDADVCLGGDNPEPCLWGLVFVQHYHPEH